MKRENGSIEPCLTPFTLETFYIFPLLYVSDDSHCFVATNTKQMKRTRTRNSIFSRTLYRKLT